MSHRYDFVTELEEGAIRLPDEILARLDSKGIQRVRVVLTSVADDEARLASRGIDSEAIDRVAGMQRFDRDVATIVLTGEGAAFGEGIGSRLQQLMLDSEGTRA
jgi:hypothetical protein